MNTISVRSKAPKQTTPVFDDAAVLDHLLFRSRTESRSLLFRWHRHANPEAYSSDVQVTHLLFKRTRLVTPTHSSIPTWENSTCSPHPLFNSKLNSTCNPLNSKLNSTCNPLNSKLKNSTCNPHPLFNYNLGKFDLQSPPTLQLQLENFHRWHCHVEYIGRHGISLSGSYRQGYSTAYNTQSHIKVVYNGYILTHI